MMDIANIAANAADHAMKANEAPDERCQQIPREGREKIQGRAIQKRRWNSRRKEDQQENDEEERQENAQGNSLNSLRVRPKMQPGFSGSS